jgi:general secretion pathway protein L
MLKLDTQIKLDFTKFFRWWFGELSFLVPGRLKKWLGRAEEFIILTKEDDSLRGIYQTSEGTRSLGRFSLDETGNGKRDQLMTEIPTLAHAKVLLRLTPHQSLWKTIKLPSAAEENLLQVLAFEMDRLTPFKSDQVYFDAKIANRSTATRQLTVELLLAPRSKLDAWIEELVTWGWQPTIVDREDITPPGKFNLLPPKYRPVRSRLPGTLNAVFAVVIVLLLSTLAILPIWVDRSVAAALEQEVRKASKTAKEVESLRQEADKLSHEARFLLQKKRTEPVVSDMLEELSRVIPDNTWLNGLQFNEKKVVIQGQSPSASSLIELIEASPYFRNTSFVSPVTKDVTSGLERFQIASEVVNGRFVEDNDSTASK